MPDTEVAVENPYPLQPLQPSQPSQVQAAQVAVAACSSTLLSMAQQRGTLLAWGQAASRKRPSAAAPCQRALTAAAMRNPKIKEYMQDQELMQKVQMLASLPGQMQQQMIMQMMNQDKRVLELFMAMQGIDVSTMSGEDFDKPEESRPPPKKKDEPKKEEAPPEDNRTPEQKEADDWKGKGNELYKKKQFKEALEMYDKAIALVPDDITYHNNRNAVLIEMGPEHYDQVLKNCQDLITRRYEINSANPGGASFEKVAKVLTRMASVYEKQGKYDEAIEMYGKALTEDNNRTTRNAMRDCERAKEKHEKEAYLDPAKAEEHREKGNEYFKDKKYVEAKAEYDEGLKRNPKDLGIREQF
ncbi:unnamed protein product [Symbiodinium natans]|uniref:STI1 domain-containing protein n=1 Tax=Symbiodinium natans TaxID=878477 RepID=A0A812I1N2_9DINO|nr:unnamed protein product [Symbiodinium natans]